jgi:hypothetical protein
MSTSIYSQPQKIECPRCKGHFTFRRAKAPYFDNQGFESYQFECKFCGASLTGIVDPSDGALLVQQATRRTLRGIGQKAPPERPLAAALRQFTTTIVARVALSSGKSLRSPN